ncbi:MAG: hypothetical protein Q9179_004634 [Wetmoreana sp. 5 TL-2023]
MRAAPNELIAEYFYHYLDGWERPPSYVWCLYDVGSGSSTYLLFDCPDNAKSAIVRRAQEGPTSFDERLNFLIRLGGTCRAMEPAEFRLLNSAVETLAYYQSRNILWKRWVEQYNERVRLIINLFFSIGSQADSRTNLKIASLTSNIAVDAQRDSSSMITIAAVTMVFLPGTFISVDIIISCPGIGPTATSTCPQQPPGVCCRAVNFVHDEADGRVPVPAVGNIRFQHLSARDIAAVWEHWDGPVETTPTGCSTQVYKSGSGPGEFSYTVAFDPNHQLVGGGSYIKVGQIFLPPDPPTIATLVRQRIVGLAWAGGTWFINSVVQGRLGGMGPSRNPNPKSRRDIRSAMKGTVYAGPPLKWVYPAYIDVDGRRYSDGGAGNLLYKDEGGAVLNLTTTTMDRKT